MIFLLFRNAGKQHFYILFYLVSFCLEIFYLKSYLANSDFVKTGTLSFELQTLNLDAGVRFELTMHLAYETGVVTNPTRVILGVSGGTRIPDLSLRKRLRYPSAPQTHEIYQDAYFSITS